MEDKERGQLKSMGYYINVYAILSCRMYFGHIYVSLDIRLYNINFPSSSVEKLFSYKVLSMVPDNVVVDAIKLILLNYSNFSIAKIVVKKIERVK